MQVILLERVEKLGQMGDEVRVKDGFARNFLLPKKKALRATKANREYFQGRKTELEARNLSARGDAEKIAKKLDGQKFVLIRQAGDRGQLYGSVSPRDIATAISDGGISVNRN
ncbi:MAG TPA: 50S ribosomal protein L9, partial [Rhizomicrobium sp.]